MSVERIKDATTNEHGKSGSTEALTPWWVGPPSSHPKGGGAAGEGVVGQGRKVKGPGGLMTAVTLPPPPLTKEESDLVLLRNRRVLLSAVIEDTLALASIAARRSNERGWIADHSG